MAKMLKPKPQPKPQWRRTTIREWREWSGKTLAEMAVAVDYNEGYLSELENGNRRYNQDLLEKIAEFLKVPVSYLLSRKPEPKSKVLDYSDPYVAAEIMSKLEEPDKRRIGSLIKTYLDTAEK